MMNMFVVLLFLLCLACAPAIEDNGVVVCPVVGSFENKTRIDTKDEVKRFGELSGLAFSPTLKGPSGEPILYGTNDGGGGERLGVWDSGTGDLLLTYVIPNATIHNQDWESLTVGSCGSTGVGDTCIYVADVGDNWARTSGGKRSTRWFNFNVTYRILKIREPIWQDFSNNEMIPESYLSVLPFNYSHSSSPTQYCDCEGMFMDQVGWGVGGAVGDLYLVPKWGAQKSLTLQRIFKIPASVWPTSFGTVAEEYSPEVVGSYSNGGDLMGVTWTRAEATFDGTVIALGNLTHTMLFLRCPGMTVAEALAPSGAGAEQCLIWFNPSRGQVETTAWTPDGLRNLQIPEGTRRFMGWTILDYDLSKSKQTCPVLEWVDGECLSVESGELLPDARCEALFSETSFPTVAGPTAPEPPSTSPSMLPVTTSPTLDPVSAAPSPDTLGTNTPPSSAGNGSTPVPTVVPTNGPTSSSFSIGHKLRQPTCAALLVALLASHVIC